MRSHAKASTAGSTQRQSRGLGRHFRGVLTTRGAHLGNSGSGALKSGRSILWVALMVGIVSLICGVGSASAVAPTIASTSVSTVTTQTARLQAEINPGGEATTYHFEYGLADCASNPCTNTPVPDSSAGSGSAVVKLSREISGLSPGTTYHYRVVAGNGSGPVTGPDRTFTTFRVDAQDGGCANQALRRGPAARMLDCRAYEMVSPVDKNGGDIATLCDGICRRTSFNQASPDGNKMTYSSATSFGDQASSQFANQYLSTRGPNGWTTHGINLPRSTTIFAPSFPALYELTSHVDTFSEDLSNVWQKSYNQTPLTPNGISGYLNLYGRDSASGNIEAVTVNQPLGSANKVLGTNRPAEVQGVSQNNDHVLFSAYAALTPNAIAEKWQLYDFSEGALSLINVLPDGTTSATESYLGGDNNEANTQPRRDSLRDHAISNDGSRIFWTAETGKEFTTSVGVIYVRIDGESTVRVSPGSASFWAASADGSEALYTEGAFLGSFGKLSKFNVDTETTTTIAEEVKGVLGASDDLSYVYFVSKEALDAGATAGEFNLYLNHQGTTRFIATVSPQDVNVPLSSLPSATSIVHASQSFRSSRATPDGRHIAFTSHASLTGYDNTDTVNGAADMEVYVYSADAEDLVCASCNPSGARPHGQPMQYPFRVREDPVENNARTEKQWAAAWLTTRESATHVSRPLSDDGNRLFFNAFDALVPEDNNGVQDVYQWEAQGSGTCQEAGGCIRLISTGESPKKSEFIDASADGRDVFFETGSSIDPDDPGLIDIYNARAGGGFTSSISPTPCVGDACQSIPPSPNDATPASANFRGAGNPVPRKARRSRCNARKHTRKRNHSSKSRVKKPCKRANRGGAR